MTINELIIALIKNSDEYGDLDILSVDTVSEDKIVIYSSNDEELYIAPDGTILKFIDFKKGEE